MMFLLSTLALLCSTARADREIVGAELKGFKNIKFELKNFPEARLADAGADGAVADPGFKHPDGVAADLIVGVKTNGEAFAKDTMTSCFTREKDEFQKQLELDPAIGFFHRYESARKAEEKTGADGLTAEQKVHLYKGYNDAAVAAHGRAFTASNACIKNMEAFEAKLAANSSLWGTVQAKLAVVFNAKQTHKGDRTAFGQKLIDTGLLTNVDFEGDMDDFERDIKILFNHDCEAAGADGKPPANMNYAGDFTCKSCARHIVAAKLKTRNFKDKKFSDAMLGEPEFQALMDAAMTNAINQAKVEETERRRRRR